MPRGYLTLSQPVDPPTPVMDGHANALRSILGGLAAKRKLDQDAERDAYTRQRNDRLDAMSERRYNDERTRAEELLDLQRQKLTPKADGLSLKDARNLALEQAYKEAEADEFGQRKAIDPKRVDFLTEYLLKYGTVPPQDAGAAAPAGGDLPAVEPPDEPAEPAGEKLADRWNWKDTAVNAIKEGAGSAMDAVSGWFGGGGEEKPPVSEQEAPVGSGRGSGVEQAERDFMAGAGGFGVVAPRHLMNRGGDKAPAGNPNVPDPDPKYLDHLEVLGKQDPDKLVALLRDLKKQSPAEFEAVNAAIRARRATPKE